MKKIILALLISIITCFSMFSQPVIEWEKKVDLARKNNLTDFIILNDGSYLSVGFTFDEISRLFNPYYFKFDCNGNMLWRKQLVNYVMTNNFEGGEIQIVKMKDNIFAISGTGYVKKDTLGNLVGLLTLIDSSGNVIKSKEFIGSQYVRVSKTISDGNNNLLLLLYTSSSSGIFQGNKGYSDIWLLKLDLNLNILVKKNIGGEGFDESTSIVKLKDGGYIITGSSTSKTGDFKAPYGVTADINARSDAFVLKLNEFLEVVWSTAFGGNQSDMSNSVLEMPDKSLVIGGMTSSYDGSFSGRPTSYTTDTYVARMGPNGVLGSVKPIGNDRTNFTSVVWFSQLLGIDSSNYLLMCHGMTREGIFNTPNEMTWLLKMNTKNEIVWKKSFGVQRYVNVGFGNRGYQIKKTMDNGYLIVGEADDSITYRENLWLLKLSPLEVNQQISCEGLTLYPNPTIGNIKIQSVDYLQTGTEIKVYDTIGRSIYQGITSRICKDSDIILPNSLSSGMYYLSINGAKKCVLPFVKVE